MVDQTLAAPVWCARSGGIGSNSQRSSPLRTSKARTKPLFASVIESRAPAEATTRSPMTSGPEVMPIEVSLVPRESKSACVT